MPLFVRWDRGNMFHIVPIVGPWLTVCVRTCWINLINSSTFQWKQMDYLYLGLSDSGHFNWCILSQMIIYLFSIIQEPQGFLQSAEL